MTVKRRKLIQSTAALTALSGLKMPAWATGKPQRAIGKGMDLLSGPEVNLHIGSGHFHTGGRSGHAIAINGTIPGPLIRLREGQEARLKVHNHLNESSSIHWHGLLLPFQFDGVPGLSFPGIPPGESFTAAFKVRQSGTYWWHSHSGLQEQLGHYGPIVIDPAEKDPVHYDREQVIVLSEFAAMHPHRIMKKLKVSEGYFNQKKTAAFDDYDLSGAERREWARMRMLPTDIADVSAPTYTYLMNGHGPEDDLVLKYQAGERVRLRFVNAGAMTFFNIRIPGLPMTVVQADGQNVAPFEVDEFQIAPAETYDVIVTPGSGSFALVGESKDRSGMARATLATNPTERAVFPGLRKPPLLTMADMGHGGHHGSHHDHGSMKMRDTSLLPKNVAVGAGIDMVAASPVDRTGFPGIGLDKLPHRVLNYRMLRATAPIADPRSPERLLELHLTGNMERYMWSFDGRKYSAVGDSPIRFAYNERVRVRLINNTMMAHPIHLHGMFFELVNGQQQYQPKKHTVIVQPGSSATFDVTTDEPGDWAFHCHLLYHMHAGMMQTVRVAFPKPT